jgi:hypothetical protein
MVMGPALCSVDIKKGAGSALEIAMDFDQPQPAALADKRFYALSAYLDDVTRDPTLQFNGC